MEPAHVPSDNTDNPARAIKLRTLASVRLSAARGSKTSPKAMMAVLHAIDNYVGEHRDWSIRQSQIVQFTNLAPRAVHYALRELERQSLIIVTRQYRSRADSARQRENRYAIVWASLKDLADSQNRQYRLGFAGPLEPPPQTVANSQPRQALPAAGVRGRPPRGTGRGATAAGQECNAPPPGVQRLHSGGATVAQRGCNGCTPLTAPQTAPLTAPPPLNPPRPVPPGTEWEGGNSETGNAGWDEARRVLADCGLAAYRKAIREARKRGLMAAYVLQLAAHFRGAVASTPDGRTVAAWQPGALFYRVVEAIPGEAIDDGWPEPSEVYRWALAERQRTDRERRESVAREAERAARQAAWEAETVELEARFGARLDALSVEEWEELLASARVNVPTRPVVRRAFLLRRLRDRLQAAGEPAVVHSADRAHDAPGPPLEDCQ